MAPEPKPARLALAPPRAARRPPSPFIATVRRRPASPSLPPRSAARYPSYLPNARPFVAAASGQVRRVSGDKLRPSPANSLNQAGVAPPPSARSAALARLPFRQP
ncbi:hypothetical protein NL676_023907 [Syzygium grande]|nr:hypothetical protein NL676_023907 [Syzygium grande]